MRRHNGLRAKRQPASQHGADIARVRQLVEKKQAAGAIAEAGKAFVKVRRVERPDRRQHPLMDGLVTIGRMKRVEAPAVGLLNRWKFLAPRCGKGGDGLLNGARCLTCGIKRGNSSFRVGQRGKNSVPSPQEMPA